MKFSEMKLRVLFPNSPVYCHRCETMKTKKDFSHFRHKNGRWYRNYCCRKCQTEMNKRSKEKNREKARRLQRLCHLRAQYGIDDSRYQELLVQQYGVCAICKKPETRVIFGSLAQLAVDHNHETGSIRGLLCGRCNRMIGLAKDSPSILQAAIEYLTAKVTA